jgi:hypothetical protein
VTRRAQDLIEQGRRAERAAILALLPAFSGDGCYDPFSKTDCTTHIAKAIRARGPVEGETPHSLADASPPPQETRETP